MSHHLNSLRRQEGFSLVELSVAMVMMVLTIGVIVAVLIGGRDSAKQQSSLSTQNAEVRQAFSVARRQVTDADFPLVGLQCINTN